jgi:hypothetical protein
MAFFIVVQGGFPPTPNVVVVIWLEAIAITQMWLQCLKVVSEVTELRRSDSPP